MVSFVSDGVDEGLSESEIKDRAVDAFADDQDMIEGALEFLAAWALSDSQSVGRKRAVRRVLDTVAGKGGSSVSVFAALEEYLQPIDGRFLSILDMTKTEILTYAQERTAAIAGEIQHIKCVEEIAQRLPSNDSTPRKFFKSKARQADLIGIISTYYGEEA
jgi:hypothetical protein